MRDKYKYQRAKNNFFTFVWKVVLGIGVLYVLIHLFDLTDLWRNIMYDVVK